MLQTLSRFHERIDNLEIQLWSLHGEQHQEFDQALRTSVGQAIQNMNRLSAEEWVLTTLWLNFEEVHWNELGLCGEFRKSLQTFQLVEGGGIKEMIPDPIPAPPEILKPHRLKVIHLVNDIIFMTFDSDGLIEQIETLQETIML